MIRCVLCMRIAAVMIVVYAWWQRVRLGIPSGSSLLRTRTATRPTAWAGWRPFAATPAMSTDTRRRSAPTSVQSLPPTPPLRALRLMRYADVRSTQFHSASHTLCFRLAKHADMPLCVTYTCTHVVTLNLSIFETRAPCIVWLARQTNMLLSGMELLTRLYVLL